MHWRILRTYDEAVPVSDVAARLVARESERSIVSVAPTDRRRIQVSLHHQHLPKLADAGLVELVADGDEVRIADHVALADDAVARLNEKGRNAPGSRPAGRTPSPDRGAETRASRSRIAGRAPGRSPHLRLRSCPV
jgi:hypothetical protein